MCIRDRANLYYETRQYPEAAQDYGQAVQLAPGNPEYLYLRGKSLVRQAQSLGILAGNSAGALYQAAISSFDRAIALKPDYSEAHFERGLTYSLLGDSDEAIKDITIAMEGEPTPNAHARLGFIYLGRANLERRKPEGDRQQAFNDYAAAVREFDAFIAEKGDPDVELTKEEKLDPDFICLLYTSPSPRDATLSRMPSSA